MFQLCPRAGAGNRRRAFTLTEILVVLAIIMVIIGLTSYFLVLGVQAVDGIVEQAENAQIPHKRLAMAQKGKILAQVRDRHVVILQNNADPQTEIAKMQKTIPLQVTHVYTNGIKGFAAVVPPQFVAALQNFPSVKYFQKEQVVRIAQEQVVPAPNGQVPSTGLRRINGLMDSAFQSHVVPLPQGPRNIGPGIPKRDTTKIVVAVMDTGIDSTHPDLHVEFAKAFGQPDTIDAFGHGTHCAGIIGAINNNIGVVGVCPGCRLWNLKVLGADGSGLTSEIVNALDFVAAKAATIRVVNMSLGSGLDQAVNDAVTACVNKGVVMVAAAGNSAIDARQFSPASADGVICVGALGDSDGRGGGVGPPLGIDGSPDDTFATFSNFGPRVDILAPGVDIVSTYPVALGSYYRDTGTSMSAPHVAGLAALLLSPVATPASGGIRNILVPGGGSAPSLGGPALLPAQVKELMLQGVGAPVARYSAIPGLAANNDTRVYPVLNAGPF